MTPSRREQRTQQPQAVSRGGGDCPVLCLLEKNQQAWTAIAKVMLPLVALVQKNKAVFSNVERTWKGYEKWCPDLGRLLMQRGWCLSADMTLRQMERVRSLLAQRKCREVDRFMVGFTRKREDQIMHAVAERFPKRKRILLDALVAHKNKKYTLSVPVFLAQADGLCFDVMGKFLFTRYHGKIGSEDLPRNRSFFSPLASCTPAVAKNYDPSKSPARILNRHAVLHGMRTDYGTRANSLRCILLIGYFAAFERAVFDDQESERLEALVARGEKLCERLRSARSEKSKAGIRRSIRHTDEAIARAIREMYGLTEKEIEIVEREKG